MQHPLLSTSLDLENATLDVRSFQAEPGFHDAIDLAYPGLQLVHRNPNVFLVHDFLTTAECEELIARAEASGRLAPSTVADDARRWHPLPLAQYRASQQLSCPHRSCGHVVRRLTALLGCDERNLQALDLVRYLPGGFFRRHHDGAQGPFSRGGFDRSARLATVFVYLNAVAAGGETRFPLLGLTVRPRRGMAVVHFPSTRAETLDVRTLHEGMEVGPGSTKWLCTTWMWRDRRSTNLTRWPDVGWPELGLPELPSLRRAIVEAQPKERTTVQGSGWLC